MVNLRASSYGKICSESSYGLTVNQANTLSGLLEKIKLTEKQAITRDELIAKRDAPFELSKGAKSYVMGLIDQQIYQYEDTFYDKTTAKGTMVEDESIDLYNSLFFTSHVKSDLDLKDNFGSGHPDIVDEVNKVVIDIKSPWSKKTFPKTNDQAKNMDYVWQIKRYLMLLGGVKEGWVKGEIAYCLVDTPDELIPDYESLSIHDMSDIDDKLKITIYPIELTEQDEKLMRTAGEAALKFAKEYKQVLLNKNK